MNALEEIGESLRRNKFRTAMTGAAIAWGIFILVTLLGASSGLQNGMQRNFGDRLVNSVDLWTGSTSLPWKGIKSERQLYFTQRETDILRRLPMVSLCSAVVKTSITATYGDKSGSVTLKGVEKDFQTIMQKTVYAGRFLNELDMQHEAKVVVIDRKLAQKLTDKEEASLLGKYLQLGNINFLIVGICEVREEWEGASAHIPLSTHQKIFSTNRRFSNISITMDTQDAAWESTLRHALSASMQFDPNDERAIRIWSQEEMFKQQEGVMAALRLFIFIVGICTLISGAVGVSNIMLVSVKERTKEIGIRKALGAPPHHIILSIIGEALAVSLLFGYIGLFAGITVMEAIDYLIPADNTMFYNPSVDIPSVLLATLILILVGVLSGYIPARKATRIQPIEAMNADK